MSNCASCKKKGNKTKVIIDPITKLCAECNRKEQLMTPNIDDNATLGEMKVGDFKEWIGLFISKQVKSELADVRENVERLKTDVEVLVNTNAVNEPIIASNTDVTKTNGEKIEELEKTIALMKTTIVNQQEFLEQLQRKDLAKNVMVTGIPDGPLLLDNDSIDDPMEKVKVVLREVNNNLNEDDYSIFMFDPFTKDDGSITHSAKVTFTSIDLRKQILANSKTLKEKGNFFKSIYCKNDETKLARKENFRLRKKAKELREQFPNDIVKIEKGVLKHRDIQVDKFDLNNQLFH